MSTKIADIRADVDTNPRDWRLVHLPTDAIYRYSGGRWRVAGKVTRVDSRDGQ